MVSDNQYINCLLVTKFSGPKVNAHQFHRFGCLNAFQRRQGFGFKCFANNTSLTSSHMVIYVSFHASPKKPFPSKGQCSCTALMTSIVVEAKENLRLEIIRLVNRPSTKVR
ncbi:hypothetical protein NQZ68_038406 [Dissostichus eleginoides]|nr:hypothetical protein NQZ68_038406 [Dissostichus eleginoides]